MRFNLALAQMLWMPMLAACQSAGNPDDYPSLAIRPAERATGTLQPVAPYIPPPMPQAVGDQLTRLAGEVANAHAAFEKETGAARTKVSAAHGSGAGTDSWSIAQVALAGLESTRSRAMIALADLDRLYVAAATDGTELARIAAARDTAVATIEEENAVVSALLGSLQ